MCRVLRLPWRVPAVAWAELSVLLLCVRDGRALFLVSPLLSPFPLFFFKPFSVEFFRFSGRSKENWRENFSKVFLRFFEFRAKFDFREKLIFLRRRVDKIKWIECCLWAPKLCFLVVVVVGRFTRQQQLLIWIFRRLVKIHNFFYFISWTREFCFALVLFAVRSWVDQQPLEKKTTATFWGFVFVVVVCAVPERRPHLNATKFIQSTGGIIWNSKIPPS